MTATRRWTCAAAAVLAIAIPAPAQTSGPVIGNAAPLPAGVVSRPYSVTLNATGGKEPYQWAINGALPDGLALVGNLVQGTPRRFGSFSFSIRVSDDNGAAATQATSITVQPALSILTPGLPGATALIGYQTDLEASGGIPPYTWSISPLPAGTGLPPGLSMTAAGHISGTPTTGGPPPGRLFSFNVVLTDSANVSVTAALSITVTTRLVILTTSLPDGAVGQPYTAQLDAQNGAPPYTWSIVQFGLPSGLTLDSATGRITGTPTNASNVAPLFSVTDSAGVTATRSISLAIAPPPPRDLEITTASQLPDGFVAAPYDFGFSVSGGSPPYTWSRDSGSLPPGLTFNAGILNGRPTAGGQYSFRVSVRDARGIVASKDFNLQIFPGPSITADSCANGTAGTRYSCKLGATGGHLPYAWSITAGTLNPDLSLDALTGEVSGTPRLGQGQTLNFNVTVTDLNGATDSKDFRIVITTLSIGTQFLLDGGVGVSYSQQLSATGGSAPYVWSVTNGALPPRLALDGATGILSGIPSTIGRFDFTVQVQDANRTSANRAFTILVTAPAYTSTVQIAGLPSPFLPNQSSRISVNLNPTYPLAISGTLTLTYQPSVAGVVDDPTIVLQNGARTARFTIPAGASKAVFDDGGGTDIGINGGTIAGQLGLAASLFVQSQALNPNDKPITSNVERQAPVISSAVATATASGLQIAITGFATSRAVSSATFTFTATGDVTYAGTPVAVPTSDVATGWFSKPDSFPYGGQFVYTQPFTLGGGSLANLQSVVITLTNSDGTSKQFPLALK